LSWSTWQPLLPLSVPCCYSPEGDPDALDIPTPCTYREAMSGEWASKWKAAMGSELASWRSTGTYVDAVPPPRTNVVDGMWLFKVKRPPGSPPVFKERYVARGFSQREGVDFFHTFAPTTKTTTLRVFMHVAALRDYELHSLDFSTALRQPVYGLRQLPREWHDTLRSTLRDLGFRPSAADSSMFVRAGPTPFFILVYVGDLVFATVDRAALVEVKSELQKRHTCTDLGELQRYLGLQITRDSAARTITLTQSHMVQEVLRRFEFQFSTTQPTPLAVDHRPTGPFPYEPFESSGPYAELVGCLILGAGAVSWRSTRTSSVATSCSEAENYAGAMAAQELRWLTFLLTDLGERPRSAPTLYAENKAMILLSQEPQLESRMKHIDVMYFLLRELQRRGQARLDFVASVANTADIFTKALPPCNHHRRALTAAEATDPISASDTGACPVMPGRPFEPTHKSPHKDRVEHSQQQRQPIRFPPATPGHAQSCPGGLLSRLISHLIRIELSTHSSRGNRSDLSQRHRGGGSHSRKAPPSHHPRQPPSPHHSRKSPASHHARKSPAPCRCSPHACELHSGALLGDVRPGEGHPGMALLGQLEALLGIEGMEGRGWRNDGQRGIQSTTSCNHACQLHSGVLLGDVRPGEAHPRLSLLGTKGMRRWRMDD
ncbi:unnamed protein product, partial [Closterium sp. NIES-53]